MPTVDYTGYRLVTGWVSQSKLFVDGDNIETITLPDDAQGRSWLRPGDDADIIAPASFVNTPTGQRFAYGGLTFRWPILNLSPKMFRYIQDTYFSPAGIVDNYFYRAWSNRLTVQTFNRASGEWETYQCYAKLSDIRTEASQLAGGLSDVQLQFTAYAEAPTGPDFSPTITPADIYDSLPYSVALFATNGGDAVNFMPIILTLNVPSGHALVSITQTGYTIEYSVNNGVSYTSSPPGNLATVTDLRFTTPNLVLATAATNTITVNMLAPYNSLGDEITFETVAVNIGDFNEDNDNASETTTILAYDPLILDQRNLGTIKTWLDASRHISANDSGSVTPPTNGQEIQRWLSVSDLNFRYFSSEGGIYVSSDVIANNKPAVTFGTGNTHYEPINPTKINDTDFIVIIALNPTNDGSVMTTGEAILSDIFSMSIYHISPTDGQSTSIIIGDPSAPDNEILFDEAQSGVQVLTFYWEAENRVRFWRNTTLVATETVTEDVYMGAFRLAASRTTLDTSPIQGFVGNIYEVFNYEPDVAMTDAEILKLQTYFADRYL